MPKKAEVKEKKKSVFNNKKVRFNKSEDNENILINAPTNAPTNAPKKENYPNKGNLDLDEDELQKEEATEEVEETEEVEVEVEVEVEEDEDEDHELDDGVEHEIEDTEVINDDILEDDLYDDEGEKKPISKKKKVKPEEEKEDDLCEYNYDEIYDEKKEEPITIVDNNERITLPKLTKYERVRLIGTRSKQIALGAKVMIKNTKGLNPIEIAKLELEEKMIPMKIKRVLPDNKVEIWKLSELDQ